MSDEARITYAALVARVGAGTLSVPVFHYQTPYTLIAYLPDWTPEAKITSVIADLKQRVSTPHQEVQVVLVSEVPRAALFGDWRAHAPEEAP